MTEEQPPFVPLSGVVEGILKSNPDLNGNFYFQGKYFKTFQELLDYENQWSESLISEGSLSILLSNLKRDILINVQAREVNFTNGDLKMLIEVYFDHFVEFLQKKTKEKYETNRQ